MEIDQIEQQLGQPVPGELRDLLRQADGVETGTGLVWSIQRIIDRNAVFRNRADFAELFRPFDELMSIGDNGSGDQFGFHRGSDGWVDGIYVWDHETDERVGISDSLSGYLRWGADFGGDSRYRG